MATVKRTSEEILGVGHSASQAEIRTAWRRLVRKHHPDRVAGDPTAVRAANRKMQEINAAAESLLSKEPTRGKREEPKGNSKKGTGAVALRGTDAAAAAKGIFLRITDRFSGRTWSTLLFIGLLAFLEQESESVATTPLNGEYALNG
jgi:curved DNA-binding protein CbpA